MQEYLVFIDDFGTEVHRIVPMSLTLAERQQVIQETIASADENTTQATNYMTQIGADLTAAKAKAVAVKAARKAQLAAISAAS
jgi:F0F1-type ATP synthase membrane subunit b/b'